MTGQETRNKLADYWKEHDIKEGEEYAIFTDITHQEWAEVDMKEHKVMKGLKSQNCATMSEAELIITALAELFQAPQIAESRDAMGTNENEAAAKTGGSIAKSAAGAGRQGGKKMGKSNKTSGNRKTGSSDARMSHAAISRFCYTPLSSKSPIWTR